MPLTGLASDPKVDYRQLLVDAKTARLYSWGDNVLKLAGTSAPCFLYPQEVYVHAIERKDEDGVSGAALSAEPNLGLRHLPARCSPRLPFVERRAYRVRGAWPQTEGAQDCAVPQLGCKH